jgi:hypothetical protein
LLRRGRKGAQDQQREIIDCGQTQVQSRMGDGDARGARKRRRNHPLQHWAHLAARRRVLAPPPRPLRPDPGGRARRVSAATCCSPSPGPDPVSTVTVFPVGSCGDRVGHGRGWRRTGIGRDRIVSGHHRLGTGWGRGRGVATGGYRSRFGSPWVPVAIIATGGGAISSLQDIPSVILTHAELWHLRHYFTILVVFIHKWV